MVLGEPSYDVALLVLGPKCADVPGGFAAVHVSLLIGAPDGVWFALQDWGSSVLGL